MLAKARVENGLLHLVPLELKHDRQPEFSPWESVRRDTLERRVRAAAPVPVPDRFPDRLGFRKMRAARPTSGMRLVTTDRALSELTEQRYDREPRIDRRFGLGAVEQVFSQARPLGGGIGRTAEPLLGGSKPHLDFRDGSGCQFSRHVPLSIHLLTQQRTKPAPRASAQAAEVHPCPYSVAKVIGDILDLRRQGLSPGLKAFFVLCFPPEGQFADGNPRQFEPKFQSLADELVAVLESEQGIPGRAGLECGFLDECR
ncbi:MAG TPA: hypothetical protein VMS17_24585 [Gemmataceae bacterium]|nr:hypothetical protein [Gemmataceae bacterium]